MTTPMSPSGVVNVRVSSTMGPFYRLLIGACRPGTASVADPLAMGLDGAVVGHPPLRGREADHRLEALVPVVADATLGHPAHGLRFDPAVVRLVRVEPADPGVGQHIGGL